MNAPLREGARAKAKRPSVCAVTLAGAVAKGAFEAGAMQVLSESELCVRRIVASSSGALNGVVYAAAVRAGECSEGASRLTTLWRRDGNWSDAIDFNWHSLWKRSGLSDQKKLLNLLRTHVQPCRRPKEEVSLDIVIAAANGTESRIGESAATTYEMCLSFANEDFDTEAGLERIFAAAVASCSFPGVFSPTELPGIGPCLDGGVVNNTPLKYALSGKVGQSLEALFVIAPTPLLAPPAPPLTGLGLVTHLSEMLINERLFRDLSEAEQTNLALGRLDELRDTLGDEQLALVKEAIGWAHRRKIDVVQVRPETVLPGDSFTALFEPDLRDDYIEQGMAAARQAIAARGWA